MYEYHSTHIKYYICPQILKYIYFVNVGYCCRKTKVIVLVVLQGVTYFS